jgi:hypothetical protein
MEDRLVGLIFAASFLIFGFILVWSAYNRHKKLIGSKSWPATMGVVIAAKNKVSFGSKGGRYNRPEVTYRYSVIGIEYTQNIRKNSTIKQNKVGEFLDSLPIGTKLKISYNPENPKDCVSEYDEEDIPLLGIGAIAFGALMLYIGILGK